MINRNLNIVDSKLHRQTIFNQHDYNKICETLDYIKSKNNTYFKERNEIDNQLYEKLFDIFKNHFQCNYSMVYVYLNYLYDNMKPLYDNVKYKLMSELTSKHTDILWIRYDGLLKTVLNLFITDVYNNSSNEDKTIILSHMQNLVNL